MSSTENHTDLLDVVQSIKKSISDVPELVHSWRFLSGVVYALNQYYQVTNHCPATKIDDGNIIQETDDVLSRISEKEQPSRNWLRGFYYNAGIMRLDACYERIFKAYLGREENKINGPDLYENIRQDFSLLFPEEYKESNFGKIRHEVNSLKHFMGGADSAEREQPELLYRALTELVAFIKIPKVTEEFKKKFAGGGIIEGRGNRHK